MWIVHAAETPTEDIAAAPDEVRDFYADLDNIKVVHPLAASVQAISRSNTADRYVQTYRVERLQIAAPRLLAGIRKQFAQSA